MLIGFNIKAPKPLSHREKLLSRPFSHTGYQWTTLSWLKNLERAFSPSKFLRGISLMIERFGPFFATNLPHDQKGRIVKIFQDNLSNIIANTQPKEEDSTIETVTLRSNHEHLVHFLYLIDAKQELELYFNTLKNQLEANYEVYDSCLFHLLKIIPQDKLDDRIIVLRYRLEGDLSLGIRDNSQETAKDLMHALYLRPQNELKPIDIILEFLRQFQSNDIILNILLKDIYTDIPGYLSFLPVEEMLQVGQQARAWLLERGCCAAVEKLEQQTATLVQQNISDPNERASLFEKYHLYALATQELEQNASQVKKQRRNLTKGSQEYKNLGSQYNQLTAKQAKMEKLSKVQTELLDAGKKSLEDQLAQLDQAEEAERVIILLGKEFAEILQAIYKKFPPQALSTLKKLDDLCADTAAAPAIETVRSELLSLTVAVYLQRPSYGNFIREGVADGYLFPALIKKIEDKKDQDPLLEEIWQTMLGKELTEIQATQFETPSARREALEKVISVFLLSDLAKLHYLRALNAEQLELSKNDNLPAAATLTERSFEIIKLIALGEEKKQELRASTIRYSSLALKKTDPQKACQLIQGFALDRQSQPFTQVHPIFYECSRILIDILFECFDQSARTTTSPDFQLLDRLERLFSLCQQYEEAHPEHRSPNNVQIIWAINVSVAARRNDIAKLENLSSEKWPFDGALHTIQEIASLTPAYAQETRDWLFEKTSSFLSEPRELSHTEISQIKYFSNYLVQHGERRKAIELWNTVRNKREKNSSINIIAQIERIQIVLDFSPEELSLAETFLKHTPFDSPAANERYPHVLYPGHTYSLKEELMVLKARLELAKLRTAEKAGKKLESAINNLYFAVQAIEQHLAVNSDNRGLEEAFNFLQNEIKKYQPAQKNKPK